MVPRLIAERSLPALNDRCIASANSANDGMRDIGRALRRTRIRK